MASNPAYADAISGIESGGRYNLLGPVTKSGDRAYGKYQVMGSNIPAWTSEVLGAPLTPQQFLDNPQAQDAVFAGKFGQYVEKYGPEGAAQAWFAGPGGVGKVDRTDILGTSVGSYGKRFMAALGQQPAANAASATVDTSPQQLTNAPSYNQIPASNAQGLPAFAWSPQAVPNFDAQPQVQAPPLPQFQLSPLQMQTPMRAPPDISRIQLALSQLPSALRGFSFKG